MRCTSARRCVFLLGTASSQHFWIYSFYILAANASIRFFHCTCHVNHGEQLNVLQLGQHCCRYKKSECQSVSAGVRESKNVLSRRITRITNLLLSNVM